MMHDVAIQMAYLAVIFLSGGIVTVVVLSAAWLVVLLLAGWSELRND